MNEKEREKERENQTENKTRRLMQSLEFIKKERRKKKTKKKIRRREKNTINHITRITPPSPQTSGSYEITNPFSASIRLIIRRPRGSLCVLDTRNSDNRMTREGASLVSHDAEYV